MSTGLKSFAVLAFALLFCLFFSLGTRGLNEPDEGRYANMAGELLEPETEGIIDPVLSDVHHYDKPPMIYWVTALSFKAFGANETAARLPSVLGALLALVGLGWAAWRWYGARVAWWSVLICGTLVQFWALARWLTPDMFLTGWVTLAIAAWVECRHRDGDWRWWLASLFCWAMAWWTKATPALLPLLALYVALIVTGDRRGRKALRLPWMLLLILVLGAPWYILMMVKHNDLVSFFFGRELMGRMTGHVDGRKGPIYYYLIISLLGWLPWWPWAVAAAKRQGIVSGWWRRTPEFWLLLVGLLIFSLTSSKLPTYTLTLAPWVALTMGRLLAPMMEQRGWRRAVWASVGIWMILALTSVRMVVPYESKLGRNSSLREVSAYLTQHGAQKIIADSYWPSLEFYFGENVYYIVERSLVQAKADKEKQADANHFLTRQEFTALPGDAVTGAWLIHYRRQKLNVNVPTGAAVTIGDFELIPLSQ